VIVSLSLQPINLPRLSTRLLRRVRGEAGEIAAREIRRGAENITIARVAGETDRFITLKVFSDKNGDRVERTVRVPKGKR